MANLDAKGFGAALRKAREAAGRDISGLAETTKIQGRYLAALEAEDWSAVPRGVIGRGFVRVVARELGVPPAELLQLYLAARGEDEAEPPRSLPEVDWKVDLGASRKKSPLIFGGVAVLVLGLGLWRWGPWGPRGAGAPPPEEALAPTVAPSPLPAPVQAPAPVLPREPRAAAAPEGAPTPPPAAVPATPAAGVPAPARTGAARLEIEASGRVWVRVEPEGGRAEERVLKPGERAAFAGNGRFRVKVSNGAAAKLFWNGEALGPAGSSSGVASLTVPADPNTLRR